MERGGAATRAFSSLANLSAKFASLYHFHQLNRGSQVLSANWQSVQTNVFVTCRLRAPNLYLLSPVSNSLLACEPFGADS